MIRNKKKKTFKISFYNSFQSTKNTNLHISLITPFLSWFNSSATKEAAESNSSSKRIRGKNEKRQLNFLFCY